MFDWLNTIFETIFDLFPRVDLLPPTEGGVKFKPGEKIQLLRPGRLYVWWPFTTEVLTVETRRRSVEVTQRLTTKDGWTVMVDTVVVFTIDDVMKALVETVDFDDTILEMAQKGTVKAVIGREFDEILEEMADTRNIRNEITQAARKALRPFGVKVEDAFVSSFAKTRVFSHDGGGFAVGEFEDE